jgi:hypothetical protein
LGPIFPNRTHYIPFTTSFFFLGNLQKKSKKTTLPHSIYFFHFSCWPYSYLWNMRFANISCSQDAPPSIMWHSQTSHRPQEELAKFGYMSKRKVETFRSLLYFDHLIEPIVWIWWFQKNNSSKWGTLALLIHNFFSHDRLIRKVTFHFTPYPLFQWYLQSKEILLNLGMKCSAFNAQGFRVI